MISSPSLSPSMVVVDCGSGYSRVSSFVQSNKTKLVHANTSRSHIRALHAVMHCPTKSTEWLKQLIEIVKEVDADATHVLLGATGGVRDRISSDEITLEEVNQFHDLLATTTELPFRARLVVLSGDEEARYEFISAEYCANKFGLVGVPATTKDKCNIGVLSSGGMSSQVFVKGVSLSLPTKIKKGNQLGLDHGMDKGTVAFHTHAKQVTEQQIPDKFGGDNVLYVAIEMFAAVGMKAGMGGGVVVPVLNAIETLSAFIDKTTVEDAKMGEDADRTWRTYVSVMSGIVGKLILERLHPESKVVFVREFEFGDDHVLKPSWPLGYAIEQLIHD